MLDIRFCTSVASFALRFNMFSHSLCEFCLKFWILFYFTFLLLLLLWLRSFSFALCLFLSKLLLKWIVLNAELASAKGSAVMNERSNVCAPNHFCCYLCCRRCCKSNFTSKLRHHMNFCVILLLLRRLFVRVMKLFLHSISISSVIVFSSQQIQINTNTCCMSAMRTEKVEDEGVRGAIMQINRRFRFL